MILNIYIINKHISVEIEISKYEKVGSGSGVARGVGHFPGTRWSSKILINVTQFIPNYG